MLVIKVGIFGVPRSGTSWLGHVFNSHPDVAFKFQPLFSYGHKGGLTSSSSAEEIYTFFEEIFESQDAFTTMTSETQRNYPTFKKTAVPTHIGFKETRYLHIIENILTQCGDVKILGLVRNPLSVIASWVAAPKEFQRDWRIHSEWRMAPSKNQNKAEEFYGFDKWKETSELFLRLKCQFSQQFHLVTYKELISAPLNTTEKLYDFCGLEVCSQVEKFLTESRSRHEPDPYSVFRANASDDGWRDKLQDEIAKQIVRELKNTPLEIFLDDDTVSK